MSDPLDRLIRFGKMQDDISRQQKSQVDFRRRKDDLENLKRQKREAKRQRKAS